MYSLISASENFDTSIYFPTVWVPQESQFSQPPALIGGFKPLAFLARPQAQVKLEEANFG